MHELTAGKDLVFHLAAHPDHPVRGGAAAGQRGAGRRHVQRARGGGRGRASARSIASSSASVYGLAEQFPTTERHHPYNNDTFYGAAKAFNEGMLRSFHAMYGLDYVALRYFNVYGPRMDIHGLYTEVLIRWMERIAAGEPPLILGDGLQTMDFVHVADIARANILAAERRRHRRGVQHRQRRRDQPGASWPHALLEAMESDLRAGARPGPRGQRRHPPAGRHHRGRASDSASAPRSACDDGLRGLVDWWRAERVATGASRQPTASAA